MQHVQSLIFSRVNKAIFRRANTVCPDKLQLRKPRLAFRQHYKAIPINVDGGGDQIQERVKILSVHACNFVKRLDVLVILRRNFRILAQRFEQKRFPDRVFSLHVHGAFHNAVVLVQQTGRGNKVLPGKTPGKLFRFFEIIRKPLQPVIITAALVNGAA